MIAIATVTSAPIRLPGALLEAAAPIARAGAGSGEFELGDESVEVGSDPIVYSKLTSGSEVIYQLQVPAGHYALYVHLGEALTPFEPRLALYTSLSADPAAITPSIEDAGAVIDLELAGEAVELRLVAESGRVEVRAIELVPRPS
jgi:hypothetical protein